MIKSNSSTPLRGSGLLAHGDKKTLKEFLADLEKEGSVIKRILPFGDNFIMIDFGEDKKEELK
jgi:hypothetical protein